MKGLRMSVVEGTVDLTLEFGASVEAVYAAWSSEEAQRVWGDPGNGWEMTFDQFRFTVGETDVCRFGPKGGEQYVNEKPLHIDRARETDRLLHFVTQQRPARFRRYRCRHVRVDR